MIECNVVQIIDLKFPPCANNGMVCILCDGSHGDNTLCQMSMEDGHEVC